MQINQFDYDLPETHIARYPLRERSSSRLLCVNPEQNTLKHSYFKDLTLLIEPNDLLVCNNSRVIPARLWGQKEQTGGRVEILIERILSSHKALAHVRASKSPKPGCRLLLQDNYYFTVQGRQDDLFELQSEQHPILTILNAIGEMPLPPYFERSPDEEDKNRYQTVYANPLGSVAAPTAGLHFDEALIKNLNEKGVKIAYLTLHVGAGTFAPVRCEDITQHKMHKEYIEVHDALCEQIRETKSRGGRIIAVGTTSLRALETASRSGAIQPFHGDTDIFIYPGFQFHCVDALITNFHLPRSTLLMLVSAFAGYENIMKAYQEAIQTGYRFYSYGDAMFISQKTKPKPF